MNVPDSVPVFARFANRGGAHAGFAILKGCFPDGAISPLKLLLTVFIPTMIAAAMFLLPVGM